MSHVEAQLQAEALWGYQARAEYVVDATKFDGEKFCRVRSRYWSHIGEGRSWEEAFLEAS